MSIRTSEPAPDLACVVLAGGLGTRLRALHPGVPKPLVPVAGRPFLDWVLGFLAAEGVSRARLSIGWLGAMIREHVGDGRRFGLDVDYAEECCPLGTGGAVAFAARGLPGERVLVLNGDSLALFDLGDLLRAHAASEAELTIVAAAVEDASRFGRIDADETGRLRGFAEKGAGGPGWVNAGAYLLERALLDALPGPAPSSLERDAFPALVAAGRRVFARRAAGELLDMGTPDGLAAADAFIRRNAARFAAPEAGPT